MDMVVFVLFLVVVWLNWWCIVVILVCWVLGVCFRSMGVFVVFVVRFIFWKCWRCVVGFEFVGWFSERFWGGS